MLDFARYRDEAAIPELWDRLVSIYCPILGHTGSRLVDYRRRFETSISGTVAWAVRDGLPFWRVNNAAHTLPPNVTTEDKAISVVVLARPDNFQAFKHIGGRHPDFFMAHNSSDIRFAINDVQARGSTPTNNQIYSWCGTYNGVNIKLYQDGEEVASTAHTNVIGNTGTFCVGSYGVAPTNPIYPYDGDIGQFLVYNRVLTKKEIILLSKDPLAPFRRRRRRYFVPAGGGGTNSSDIFGSTIFGGSVVA